MDLETITCNNCGAPLQVPAGARFITCKHCQSNLAIHRNDSATYTETVAEIDQRTQEMAGDLAQLRYESELARLDREWEQERQRYLVRTQNGQVIEPSGVTSVIGGIVALVAGVVWMAIASSFHAGAFPLFGLVFIAIGIGAAISGANKAKELNAAKERYRLRRSQLSVDQFRHSDSTNATSTGQETRANGEIDAFLDRAQQSTENPTERQI